MEPRAGALLRLVRLERPEGSGEEVVFRLEIPADLNRMEEAIEMIASQCAEEFGPLSSRALFRLRVLLAEAISNGILFGSAGNPERRVRIEARLDAGRIRLEVTDEGPGFDPAGIPDPTLPDGLERPIGRGLFLIRHLADQVEFNDRGNTIWMTLARS